MSRAKGCPVRERLHVSLRAVLAIRAGGWGIVVMAGYAQGEW
ncbi:MAG: hypothetical protein ACM359_21150 [Bacillota bacterium]